MNKFTRMEKYWTSESLEVIKSSLPERYRKCESALRLMIYLTIESRGSCKDSDLINGVPLSKEDLHSRFRMIYHPSRNSISKKYPFSNYLKEFDEVKYALHKSSDDFTKVSNNIRYNEYLNSLSILSELLILEVIERDYYIHDIDNPGNNRPYYYQITDPDVYLNSYDKIVLDGEEDIMLTPIPTSKIFDEPWFYDQIMTTGLFDQVKSNDGMWDRRIVTGYHKSVFGHPSLKVLSEVMERIHEHGDDPHLVHSWMQDYLSKSKRDLRSFDLISKKCHELRDEILHYQPQYTMSISGRLHEKGEGVQNLTGRTKKSLYDEISRRSGINTTNYDLESSQLSIMIQEAESKNLDINLTPLKLWSSKEYQEQIAQFIKIESKYLKGLVLSHIFGSPTHTPYASKWKEIEEIYGYETANGFRLSYTTLLGDLLTNISKFRHEYSKYLISAAEDSEKAGKSTIKEVEIIDGKAYFNNGLVKAPYDLRLKLDEYEDDYTVDMTKTAKLTAFFLQGIESSFIYHLIVNSSKYGFLPISYEYDGIVTFNEIPVEAIEAAKEASGFHTANLVIKSFV